MKWLYKNLCLLLAILFFNQLNAQNNFFADAPESAMKSANQKRVIVPNKFRSLALDVAQLKQFFKTVPMEFTESAKTHPAIMSIPMPDGTVSHYSIVESPIMEPELAAKFPNIKTYSGQGIEDKTATIKIDWTELGFHAMTFSALTPSISIDPYSLGNTSNYISYAKINLNVKPFVEAGVEKEVEQQVGQMRTQSGFCVGGSLRRYRIAVAATGEYTTFFGGTVANGLSAITTTINRITGVYEKELSVRLVLVANNNLIVYTDAASDPFTTTAVNSTMLAQNQAAIDGNIGSANYDIGHVVSTIDGGGLAGLGVVCVNGQKARGATGLAAPSGDFYDIDYVAHEIGHQFGGNHTFNSGTGSCGGGNRNASTSVEPGSGVTIMAYAGICTSTNDLAAHSIPYFHSTSLVEIGNFTNNSSGNNCATITATANSVPVVNAGADYTIPVGAPFMLTGSATDANGDALTYSWEEIDPGNTTSNWNGGSTPFFRSFTPSVSPTRYFPKLSDIATGITTIGEILPAFAQTLNFRLTARDNRNGGGGVCSDEMVLNVASASSSFVVSSQGVATSWIGNGSNTATITWDVAGTTASPFNVANVAILFSADGGLTFPYTLLATTANDGSETIIIPAINTAKGRIMVKALGNVFFNVNTSNITVTASSCNAEGAVISPSTDVVAAAGSATLNLSLSPQYAAAFAASGNISTTDPTSNLSILNAGGTACTQYSNTFSYDTYPFTVSVSGNYTFQRTGAGTIFNFYTGSYNPASPCNNFITSNYTDGVGTAASVTVNLTAGVSYVLVEGVYWTNATTPAQTLPFSYSFAVTATPVGGAVYNGSGIYLDPGFPTYSYTYVIVQNATNTIKAITTSPNLSNATNYPNGNVYTVYGISYLSSQATTLNSYVGGSFTALTAAAIANPATFCANLSKNSVSVTVQSSQALVPVSFLGLKARKQDKNILLEWATASEINSDYFELQRSADGASFTTSLGKLTAAGNSISIKNYSVLDAQPLGNWNYYRVKQVDKDGKTAYSNIAAINFEKAAALIVIYPNPAKDKLTIEYTSTKIGNVQLQVLDSKGSLVLSNTVNMIVGRNTNNMNISTLSKGVYMLRSMDTDGNVNFVKFIKE